MMTRLGAGYQRFNRIGNLLNVLRTGQVVLVGGDTVQLTAQQKQEIGNKVAAMLDELEAGIARAEQELG